MSSNISNTELTLLQYLQEHAGVSGGRIGLDPKAIRRMLRLSAIRLAEDSAALVAHGFAGVRHARSGAEDGAPSTTCLAIWLTSKGEDYLKQSQSARREAATTPVALMGSEDETPQL